MKNYYIITLQIFSCLNILNNKIFCDSIFPENIHENQHNISYHKKMNEKIYDVAIIGNGPGGISAGIYTGRAKKSTIIFTGPTWGGHLTTTTLVYNYPGYKSIDGLKLIENMMDQLVEAGCLVNNSVIKEVIFSEKKGEPHKLFTSDGEEFQAFSIIIATGAKHKHLPVKKSEIFNNKGIYYCATCDGTLFANNKNPVIVVGGGNTALTEALYLSGICKKVILIHRRDEFRGEPFLVDEVKKTKNIEILWNTEVDSLEGDENENQLICIRVINNKTKTKTTIETNGVFIAIGFIPNSQIFKNTILGITEDGYIITDFLTLQTNIMNVYAVGDVTDKIYRQAITAAGDGCKAAINVIANTNSSSKQ
jgi:thioredoxin reductase (NADPH)